MVECTDSEGNTKGRLVGFDDIYSYSDDSGYADMGYGYYYVDGNNIETAVSSAINTLVSGEIKNMALVSSHSNSDIFERIYAENLKLNGFEISKIDNPIIQEIPENIDVSWGSYSQIQAYNYMFRYVREYGEFDYYSLNSGNDLFIRPINEFIDFVQQTNQYAYYNCEPLPKSYWQYRGGFGRIELYWPKIFLKRYSDRHILRYLRTIYGTLYHYHLLPSRKLPTDIHFFGGT